MKKITLALLILAVTTGPLWAYEGTWSCDYDTAKFKYLKVTEGYDLLGSGGAGYADSLRDSTETTHAADLYARKDIPEIIGALRTFQESIHLNGGADMSQYIYWGPGFTRYIVRPSNYPDDLWISTNVRVKGDTLEAEFLKAKGSNLPGMIIYSGDSTYETTCWFEAGANMSITLTDSGIKYAAVGTTSATKSDSVLDTRDSKFHGGAEFGRLNQDQDWPGTQTFLTNPIFMGNAHHDSTIPNDITIDSAAVCSSAYKLGDYVAVHYPRKAEDNLIMTGNACTFEGDFNVDGITTLGDNPAVDSLVVQGKAKVFNDVTVSAVEIHPGASPYEAWSSGDSKGSGTGNLLVRNDIQSQVGRFLDSLISQGTTRFKGYVNFQGGSNITVDSTAKAGWAGTMSDASIQWSWLNSTAQESARGVNIISSGETEHTGEVRIESGTGISIANTDTGLIITASGGGTVGIAESLDVKGTAYAGSSFAITHIAEGVTGDWNFGGTIDFVGDVNIGNDNNDVFTFNGDYALFKDGVYIMASGSKGDSIFGAKGGGPYIIYAEDGGWFGADVYIDSTLQMNDNIVMASGKTVDGYDVSEYLDGAEKDAKDNVVSGGNGIVVTPQADGDYSVATDPGFALEHSAGEIRVKTSSLAGTALSGGDGGPLNVQLGTTGGTACEGSDSRLGRIPTIAQDAALDATGYGALTPGATNGFTTKSYVENNFTQLTGGENPSGDWVFQDNVGVNGITTLGDDATLDSTINKGKLKIYNDVMISGVEIHPGQSPYVAWSTGIDKGAGSGNLLVRNDIQSRAGIFIDSVRTKDIRVTGNAYIYTGGSAITVSPYTKQISVPNGAILTEHIGNGTINTDDISASADITKGQISNIDPWQVAEIPQNIIINSSGTVDLTALNPGITFPIYSDFTYDTTLAGSAPNVPIYHTTSGSPVVKVRCSFWKTACISYVKVRFEADINSEMPAETGTAHLYVGLLNQSAPITEYNWASKFIEVNVSSLSNGTKQQITFSLQRTSVGVQEIFARELYIYGASESGL